MLLLKKGGTLMRNKKKIKVTLAMINVLLTAAVELYLQWQLSKSENEL
jgi:flagellar basal body-associated protein FliL